MEIRRKRLPTSKCSEEKLEIFHWTPKNPSLDKK